MTTIEFIIQILIITLILIIARFGDNITNYIKKRVSTQTYDLIYKIIIIYSVCLMLVTLLCGIKLVIG